MASKARSEPEDGFNFDEHGSAGEHMKAMWAGQSNVLVATRVRPLMKHDVIKRSCVRAMDGNMVVILDPASGDKADVLRINRNKEKQYAFDHVFDGSATQESIYLSTTKFLIHGVLDGYNATVFAYGQTGSGKTYTMIGTQHDPGIMVRVMADLFIHSAKYGKQQGVLFKVTVSFLEVYNENIRDLLGDAEEYLDLREDPIKGPVVAGITEVETNSSEEIMNLLHQGNAKRSQAATAANEVSSRSHAVLQVVVESRDRAPGVVANIKVGKLSLVDLAGSERAANTKNTGARLVEGANINRSLLALGNCINALGEKGNKGNFVPYRDSKLTRLLKDSLGGNCRTVMIANISSSESSFEETLNTLKYANRAKNIKTNVQRNVLNVNYHISEYVQLIDNLRGEIKLLKDQIGVANHQPSLEGDVHQPAFAPHSPYQGAARLQLRSPNPSHISAALRQPSTPLQMLRESLRSAASITGNEGRDLVNNMRKRIVDNFQERMQLRRSLIELEDQNVQNSIEVSKRQLLVVQWTDASGHDHDSEFFADDVMTSAPSHIQEAWTECEQIRKAIAKNNGMKKNIAKRLRLNEKEAESFRDELSNKITGEDRLELMELQYQVGKLELENMELEQHRIVHESIVKGKDLIIQKLRLQLAVKDKLISHQQKILVDNDLHGKIGHSQLMLMEQTLMGDVELNSTMAPPSPPRNISDLYSRGKSPLKVPQLTLGIHVVSPTKPKAPSSARSHNDVDALKESVDERIPDGNFSAREREVGDGGDWNEAYSEEFSDSFDEESDMSPNRNRAVGNAGKRGGDEGMKGIGILEGRGLGIGRSNAPKAGQVPAAAVRNGRHYRANTDDIPVYALEKQPLRPAQQRDPQRKYQSYPDFVPPASTATANGAADDSNYSDESDSIPARRFNEAQPKIGKKVHRGDPLSIAPSEKEKDKKSGPSDMLKLQLKSRQEQLQAQSKAQQLQFDQLHLSPGRGPGAGFRQNVAMIFPTGEKEISTRDRDNKAGDKQPGIKSRQASEESFDDFKVLGVGQGGSQIDSHQQDRKIRLQQHLQLSAIPERDLRRAQPSDYAENYAEESFDSIDDIDVDGRKAKKIPQSRPANLQIAGHGAIGGPPVQQLSVPTTVDDGISGIRKGGARNHVVLGKLKTRIAGGNSAAALIPSATPSSVGDGASPGMTPILAPVSGPGAAGIGGVSRPTHNLRANKSSKTSAKALSSAASATSSSDGGAPTSTPLSIGVPAVPVLVPSIGGRNRSLPNLSKQHSGPNSARSNKGDDK